MKELSNAIALLFAIEGDGDFEVFMLDPPFIHSNYGCFSLALGEIVEKTKIEITPMALKNNDNIEIDYHVICFIDKEQINKESGNTVIVKNDDRFKLKWNSGKEFAKTIEKKFWINFNKV